MTNFVRPNESTIILEPSVPVCRAQDKLRLLVAVHSAPENRERRRIIRKTWGSAIKTLPGVRIIFTFGLAETKQIQVNFIKRETCCSIESDLLTVNITSNDLKPKRLKITHEGEVIVVRPP